MLGLIPLLEQSLPKLIHRLVTMHGDDRKYNLTKLLEHAAFIRPFLLTHKEAAVLWESIRNTDPLTDIVLLGTADLNLILQSDGKDLEALTTLLAASHSVCSVGNVASAIDDSLKLRMASKDELMEILSLNPWLVFLLVITTLSPDVITEISVAINKEPRR